jgi:hypothetical protein
MDTLTDLLCLGDTDVLDSMNTDAFVFCILLNDSDLTITKAMPFAETLLHLLNVANSTDFFKATFKQQLLVLIRRVETGAHPKRVRIVDTLRNMFHGFLSDPAAQAQPSPEPQQQIMTTTMTTEITTATATATAAATAITTITTLNHRTCQPRPVE